VQGKVDTLEVMDSRRFLVTVRRLADSFNYGIDRSPYLGSGLEFVQSRPYQMGDSVRNIDWRVTARTGRVYVKEYEAPKRMCCYLLLDTSASMTIGMETPTKYGVALGIAGGLALACLDRAMPVGVVGAGEREFRIEPSLSRDRVLEWVHRLQTFRFNETTSLARRVADLGNRLGSRSLIVVLSDMHDPTCTAALKVISQRHECVVLQMRDRAERGLPGAGVILAREAETGYAFVTRGRQQWIDQENIDQTLKRSRIDHLIIDTHEPYAHRLRNFFRSRDVLGRGTR
jgi:uncharacterized protein (DUF58 family)